MSVSGRFPDSVLVEIPDWLYGGNPADFASAVRWVMTRQSGTTRGWMVQLDERVTGTTGDLEVSHRIADADDFEDVEKEGVFASLAAQQGMAPGLSDEFISSERDRILSERPGDFVAAMYLVGLDVVVANGVELAGVVTKALRVDLLPRLPHASVHLITIDPALSMRMAAIRLQLQVAEDPNLLVARPITGPDGFAFPSSRDLFSDTAIGLDAYLSPLFLSLAPWVWGVTAPRRGGVLAFVFGEAIVGRRGEASELLQIFSPRGRLGGRPGPGIPFSNFDKAIEWWITHLDQLFTVATDPCRYLADDGSYDAFAQLERVLTLEQGFRTVQSLSILDRDVHAQRGLLFDGLDTISGLRSPAFDELCKLTVAKNALSEIELSMNSDVAEVLLPRARAAVTALEELQKGFFLPSRVSSAGVRLPFKGGERIVDFETAAALYLRALRNGGHGFGGRLGDAVRDRALLASHNGNIPVALADLIYLYLLRILADPESIR